MIPIIDFGSQYTMLIARNLREMDFLYTIIPYHTANSVLPNLDYNGIILSGSPFSVNAKNSPLIDIQFLKGKKVLGICYGMQLIACLFGGSVGKSVYKSYGKAIAKIDISNSLFSEMEENQTVWMSHGDTVTQLPNNAVPIAWGESGEYAGFCFDNYYGIQFHPEVHHTKNGKFMLKNFCNLVVGEKPNLDNATFIDLKMKVITQEVQDQNVLLALSGGVDSTVLSYLLFKALGKKLHLLYINTGLMRKNESEEICSFFSSLYKENFHCINSEKLFYKRLKGVIDPERKRKIIGKIFIDIFTKHAKKLPHIAFLAQGTLYPDVIESSGENNTADTIKSHHNVGGLPKKMKFKLLEPFRDLFKDEVRYLGELLEVPHTFLYRKPFPGPGLAIRILGYISEEKIAILQEADWIVRNEIQKNPEIDQSIWQLFAVLLPIKSVGIKGDERTYENTLVIRAVSSRDGMTADWSRIPFEMLDAISRKVINEVPGINRVVYDITSKPPATIEWE